MKLSLSSKLTLFLISTILSIIFLEFQLRFWRIGADERNLLYNFHPELGWFPKKKFTGNFNGAAKRISINHNSSGFREIEFSELMKKKKRILFLGDSFAYGYDSEVNERFSNIIGKDLQDYSIFNLGVSGYSTDQELLLLKKYFDIIEPTSVYLLYHHNDYAGNSVNEIYNGYFKPYYKEHSDGLKLEGVPVRKGVRYLGFEYPTLYRSNIVKYITAQLLHQETFSKKFDEEITFELIAQMKKFVERKKSTFKIGVVGNGETPNLIDFLKKKNLDYLIIDGKDKDKADFTISGHWSIKGNLRAASLIKDHLFENSGI